VAILIGFVDTEALLIGWRPLWSFVVGVSLTLSVSTLRMQGVLCAVSWRSFPVPL
jgi:hypothetical protein